jgi:RimJ/RimL family protein N-acetyltransferase
MVKIQKLDSSHTDELMQIRLKEEQIKFAGTAEEFLASASESTHLHIIKNDNTLIGFFKIDTAFSEHFSFCPKTALGLRAFVIDSKCQGNGFGTEAVKSLLPYLHDKYTDYSSIYLTVNCKNPAARACYLKGGFSDNGDKYLGGPAGPQHILYTSFH